MESQESSVSRQVEPRNGSTWTVDEDALLTRLRFSSASWEEITDRIGRTESSCKSRYYKIMAQMQPWVDKNELARLYD
ncbi:hypothetical protein E4U22_002107, partial [Claviceps purpurea]